jgi:hypothetical protein
MQTDILATLEVFTYCLIEQSNEDQMVIVQIPTLDVDIDIAENITCFDAFNTFCRYPKEYQVSSKQLQPELDNQQYQPRRATNGISKAV